MSRVLFGFNQSFLKEQLLTYPDEKFALAADRQVALITLYAPAHGVQGLKFTLKSVQFIQQQRQKAQVVAPIIFKAGGHISRFAGQ